MREVPLFDIGLERGSPSPGGLCNGLDRKALWDMSDTAKAQIRMALEALQRLDVRVRFAPLGGCGGGLCHLKGQVVLFVDEDADQDTQASQCVDALSIIPQAKELYLPPLLRDAMDSRRKDGVQPDKAPNPPGESKKKATR